MVIVLFMYIVSSSNTSFILHQILEFSDNRTVDLLRKSKLTGKIQTKENKTSQTLQYHKYKSETLTLEKQWAPLFLCTQIRNLQQITVEAFPSKHIMRHCNITKGKD